jgi:hypothetical protein
VARDQLDAFLAANNMPSITGMTGRVKELKQELADTERIEKELAKLPAEVRGRVAAMIDKVRNEPDPMAALMELLCDEPEPEKKDP